MNSRNNSRRRESNKSNFSLTKTKLLLTTNNSRIGLFKNYVKKTYENSFIGEYSKFNKSRRSTEFSKNLDTSLPIRQNKNMSTTINLTKGKIHGASLDKNIYKMDSHREPLNRSKYVSKNISINRLSAVFSGSKDDKSRERKINRKPTYKRKNNIQKIKSILLNKIKKAPDTKRSLVAAPKNKKDPPKKINLHKSIDQIKNKKIQPNIVNKVRKPKKENLPNKYESLTLTIDTEKEYPFNGRNHHKPKQIPKAKSIQIDQTNIVPEQNYYKNSILARINDSKRRYKSLQIDNPNNIKDAIDNNISNPIDNSKYISISIDNSNYNSRTNEVSKKGENNQKYSNGYLQDDLSNSDKLNEVFENVYGCKKNNDFVIHPVLNIDTLSENEDYSSDPFKFDNSSFIGKVFNDKDEETEDGFQGALSFEEVRDIICIFKMKGINAKDNYLFKKDDYETFDKIHKQKYFNFFSLNQKKCSTQQKKPIVNNNKNKRQFKGRKLYGSADFTFLNTSFKKEVLSPTARPDSKGKIKNFNFSKGIGKK